MPLLVPAPHPTREYVFGDDSVDGATPLVWTVESFFSAEECAAAIERVEKIGFAAAPITTAGGFEMRPEIRNNTRVVLDDATLAAELVPRARPHVPERMFGGAELAGINERFRFYRYEKSQRFAPHYDGAFLRSRKERSLLTFMVYLNDGFAGGPTRFLDFDVEVKPVTGLALFFQHALRHEGGVVHDGVKYVLRTDVMYRAP